MPTMQRVTVLDEQGRASVRLIPADPPAPPSNPPLSVLNANYREADAERRDEVQGAVKAASGAMTQALMNRVGRRQQKNLRPAIAPRKAG